MKRFRDLSHALLRAGNFLLPTQCLVCGCGLQGQLICGGCRSDLPWLNSDAHYCRHCALLLQSTGNICGHCLKHPPAFTHSYIPFAYDHPLATLIHRFKYRRKLASGKLLGNLFADYIATCAQTKRDWQTPDLLIATPMHWTRLWLRGYNQVDIFARYLAKATAIPLGEGIIASRKRTPPQNQLTRQQRQKNLRNSFYLTEKSHRIRGKCIALIDDVMTTTATMRELSQLLINGGAKEVQVWALARTMEHS